MGITFTVLRSSCRALTTCYSLTGRNGGRGLARGVLHGLTRRILHRLTTHVTAAEGVIGTCSRTGIDRVTAYASRCYSTLTRNGRSLRCSGRNGTCSIESTCVGYTGVTRSERTVAVRIGELTTSDGVPHIIVVRTRMRGVPERAVRMVMMPIVAMIPVVC